MVAVTACAIAAAVLVCSVSAAGLALALTTPSAPADTAGVTQPIEPRTTYEQIHAAYIDLQKDGCGLRGVARLDPPFPPGGLQLNIGDSFELVPTSISGPTVIGNWSGAWTWTVKCGKKDKCPKTQPTGSDVILTWSDNAKFFATLSDGPPWQGLLMAEPLKRVIENKPAVLHVIFNVGAFSKSPSDKGLRRG